MPIKLNNGALRSVVDVKLNNGSLRTVTGIWYNNGGTLRRVYPEFYTQTVYDGSNFFDFMKSGVHNEWYMNTQYVGQYSGYGAVNTDFGPNPITSGSLWMDHADEGGGGYDGFHGEFISLDQINFSKFNSITISGTHFMDFHCNDPVSLTYDPYISIFQSNSNTDEQRYGNGVSRSIYTNPPKKVISSDDGGGGSWSGSFSLTFDISSWTSTNKYLDVYLRPKWNTCLTYGDGARCGMTITKIIFTV